MADELLPVAALDGLDADAFERAIAPLFERATVLAPRLAAERPFASWSELLDRAQEIAAALPDEEKIRLLDAHPRIGAPPGSVSPMSFREQGYDREQATEAAERERARVQDELDRLNAAYEARFGFRFVVFVAGRPRAAIVPVMEEALGARREDELRRATADVVAIARDRAQRMGAMEEVA
jgi:2-oxo-4-hydroxy-4-carboxy--5-ureidoimidazoline (OHCU) decarboxylase